MTKGEFEELYLKFRPGLVSLARNTLARNYHTSYSPEDVLQDAVLKVYRILRPDAVPAQVLALLYKAVSHAAIDAIRKQVPMQLGHGGNVMADQWESNGDMVAGAWRENQDTDIDSRATPDDEECWAVLADLADKLHPSYSDVLAVDYCGMTAEEGAALLGVTVSAYKTRLYRARKAAQKIVGPLHLFASLPRPIRRIVR